MTKNWIYSLSLVLALTANLALAGGAAVSDRLKCNKATELPVNASVDRVVDGDTVIIRVPTGTYSVRMMGIDTPETHFMGKSQGEWGDKAAELLSDLLPVGTKVRLEYTAESCDAHGRLLAHVFKGKLHTNAEMVKQGLAANYCVAPSFEYCREIGNHVANAIKYRLGMFADSNAELPYDFRRRIGGNEQRSFVGNLSTKEVLTPGHQDDVPVAERVFFYRQSDVKAPYFIAK
ncbi:MAG: thermonuclease family protein [Bacteriovoracia bacterium]